jgi:hypothetical protein
MFACDVSLFFVNLRLRGVNMIPSLTRFLPPAVSFSATESREAVTSRLVIGLLTLSIGSTLYVVWRCQRIITRLEQIEQELLGLLSENAALLEENKSLQYQQASREISCDKFSEI